VEKREEKRRLGGIWGGGPRLFEKQLMGLFHFVLVGPLEKNTGHSSGITIAQGLIGLALQFTDIHIL